MAIDRDGHSYGDEVVVTINQDRIEDYSAAARALREAGVQVVLIQHEYGIFGGTDGSHLLELTRALNACGIPYLLTLHTVLSRPSPGQAATLRALVRRRRQGHGVHRDRPPGRHPHRRSPPVTSSSWSRTARPTRCAAAGPGDAATDLRELLATVAGKPTLTTFGLLSDGKGIDIAIDALAEVVKEHPETQYIVAGATHPEIKRREGEVYREQPARRSPAARAGRQRALRRRLPGTRRVVARSCTPARCS